MIKDIESLEEYYSYIRRFPLLSKEQEKELFLKTKNGDKSAEDNTEEEFLNNQLIKDVRNYLENSSLTEKDKKVLKLRFGIGYDKRYTLAEISQKYHVTIGAIRKTEKKQYLS